jgi:ABC-type Fe3+-hydroxamate transport system substrate-binding protein
VKTLKLVTLQDLMDACDSIGLWMHHPEKSEEVKEEVQVSISPYLNKWAGSNLTMGVLSYSNPIMVYGGHSWMQTKLSLLGLKNAFERKQGSVAPISSEELFATQMDILAVSRLAEPELLEILKQQKPDLQIVYLDDDLASRPSTRLAEQLEDICKAIEAKRP